MSFELAQNINMLQKLHYSILHMDLSANFKWSKKSGSAILHLRLHMEDSRTPAYLAPLHTRHASEPSGVAFGLPEP